MIHYEEEWGSVCDNIFTGDLEGENDHEMRDKIANMICVELGFESGYYEEP